MRVSETLPLKVITTEIGWLWVTSPFPQLQCNRDQRLMLSQRLYTVFKMVARKWYHGEKRNSG